MRETIPGAFVGSPIAVLMNFTPDSSENSHARPTILGRSSSAISSGLAAIPVPSSRPGLEEAARWPQNRQQCPYFYLGSESLATALSKKGDIRREIQVLERASERKFLAVATLDPTVPYWMRNRLDLARLYRSVGRQEEARAIEVDLLKLLALADADHPMLLELRRLQSG